jgi:hypothetical protein
MNMNLEEKLYQKFGKFFSFSSDEGTGGYIPLECEDGWFQIIWGMCEKLEKFNSPVRFMQVKEKYGTLRVYYSGIWSDIDEEIIEQTEKLSETTCEICGNPGKIEVYRGWYKCYCLDCWNKLN